MNPITATEDSIIAASNEVLKKKVRDMESLPGRMSLQVLKNIAAKSPAVYVAYLGGRKGVSAHSIAQHKAVFAIYIVSDSAEGRRGNERKIGAYDIINTLVPTLNDHQVTDVGTLEFQRVENLFSVELNKQGVSIYAAVFEMPMSLDYQVDEAALDNFVTYSATHSIAPGDDEPDAEDKVQLEQ